MEYNILHMMSEYANIGVEISSEVPHHFHGHSWCYLLDFFPNCLPASTFTGVRTVFGRPGGSFFNVDPVSRTESTHLKIVFRLGTLALRPSWK